VNGFIDGLDFSINKQVDKIVDCRKCNSRKQRHSNNQRDDKAGTKIINQKKEHGKNQESNGNETNNSLWGNGLHIYLLENSQLRGTQI
jgi:hypothetical protein